jgi:hypothetical protein
MYPSIHVPPCLGISLSFTNIFIKLNNMNGLTINSSLINLLIEPIENQYLCINL